MLLIALALWCINHPYIGFIEHDARVYSLLVWHWLFPEAYARDPFFLFGSQDRYSIFTPIYGVLTTLAGLPSAAMAIVALGGFLWVISAGVNARHLITDRRWQVFAVLLCATMSFNYSPNATTFFINEAFPTARSLSFPVGALAVGFLIGERYWAAAAVAAFSCALHPLLGVWPLLLVIAHRMSDRVLLLFGAGLAAAIWALSAAGVPALQRMDTEWENIARHSSVDIFVGLHGKVRLNETVGWLSLLLWAGHLSSGQIRRIYQLSALIGAAGFLLAQFASYLSPVVLIVQAQTWRAMWLAVYVGIFAVACLMERAARREFRILSAIGGLLLVILSDWAGYLLLVSYVLLIASIRLRARCFFRRVAELRRRYLLLLLIGLLLAVLPSYVQDLIVLGRGLAQDFHTGSPAFDGFFLAGGLGVGALIWALLLTARFPVSVTAAVGTALLVYAVLHWDQRLEAYRVWEGLRTSRHYPMFSSVISRGDVVLWPGGSAQRVWHELGTANYGSSDQVIGGIFSREKTFDMLRRRQRLAIASLAESWPLSMHEESRLLQRYRELSGDGLDVTSNLHESYKAPFHITGPGMLHLCEDVALDWVISDTVLEQGVLTPIQVSEHQGTWLYSCRTLRLIRNTL